MHLLAYVFFLKKVLSSQPPKIFEGLLTKLFLTYLIPEGIPRRPVQTVLALFQVLRRVSTHYFSLTNLEVPDPLSSHEMYRGVLRYILGKFARLVLVMFFC
jgi:hypothetical protein